MFQLDKLSVIVAEKHRCPIRLRGAIAIGALSETAIRPSVCPSPRCAAAQGAQLTLAGGIIYHLAGAARSLAMCGLRTRPRTDVDPPRVELTSLGAYLLAAPRCDNLFME